MRNGCVGARQKPQKCMEFEPCAIAVISHQNNLKSEGNAVCARSVVPIASIGLAQLISAVTIIA